MSFLLAVLYSRMTTEGGGGERRFPVLFFFLSLKQFIRERRKMAWASWGVAMFQKGLGPGLRVVAPSQVIVCRKKEKREKNHHPYKVIEITPPPRNLGIRCFPSNLQCGEVVEIEGEAYTISAVTHRYQLRKGRYEPREKRLDVLSTGRYILNLYLENLLEKS
ncbi:hypothetical protein Dimus_013660 [Dionaea muscipula]